MPCQKTKAQSNGFFVTLQLTTVNFSYNIHNFDISLPKLIILEFNHYLTNVVCSLVYTQFNRQLFIHILNMGSIKSVHKRLSTPILACVCAIINPWLFAASEIQQSQSSPQSNDKQPFVIEGTTVDAQIVNQFFNPNVWEAVLRADGDNRKLIEDTSLFPFNTVGKLTMMCPTLQGMQPGTCTATIIGPKTIITAAHCVYDARFCKANPDGCSYCEDFQFQPGYPHHNNTYEIHSSAVPNGYFLGAPSGSITEFGEYDMAILTLKSDLEVGIPEAKNVMSYGFYECENANDVEIFIAGYPDDLGGEKLYMSECKVNYNNCGNSTAFFYDCDTFGGMSGSIIWARNGNDIVIKGIHSRYDIVLKLNAGVMFNRESAVFVKTQVVSQL
eukprot:TRINITY_DN4374_c0_g1_i4.p1 TRINITY_DN4374_c0_g1~~TRINITY_DN4374_c0_g1_i4.p1  ORF type:complete len:386 (-),score=15.08 TRINITY_DN4374_c0_g1_i4:853-2010(-)